MKVASNLLALFFAVWAASRSQAGAASTTIEYNRDVRPILSENCFTCHGADSAARKAKLRLDRFEEATASHKDSPAAIVPGNPKASEVLRRIFDKGDDLMPPAKTHKTLSAAQKDLIRRWIEAGAKYQPQWSLIAPKRPELPIVKNTRWARTPIDKFILARLETEKLKPAPEADRRTLVRRVTLDLTGLPPAPQDVEAFVNDPTPDAYDKLVDRLLNSPQWGEHRARYWLDVARYADSNGIHYDNFREMWTYRDWVINAFNRNMPFDQFTVEQLAGDLLPNATLEQKIASGFNRCNITTSEGGAIDEEYLVLYARDRTDTSCQVWLGLTAGCAVCHDHKYDPLSQKEFYQFSAFFNNTTQKAMDGNAKDTPPIIVVPRPEDRARWEALTGETNAAQKHVDDRRVAARKDFETWLSNPDFGGFNAMLPKAGPTFHAALSEGQANSIEVAISGQSKSAPLTTNSTWVEGAVADRAWLTPTNDGPEFKEAGDFENTNQITLSVWVKPGTNRNGSVVARMKDTPDYRGWDLLLENGKLIFDLVHKWPENALRAVAKQELPKDKWSHVCFTYDGSLKAKGVKLYVNGKEEGLNRDHNSLTNTIRTDTPLTLGRRTGGQRLELAGIQDLRLFTSDLSAAEVKALATVPRLEWIARKPAASRSQQEKDELFAAWLPAADNPYQALVAQRTKLFEEAQQIRERSSVAHVMHERDEAAEAYLLFRGDYDKRRDKLAPGTPAALPPMPADLPRNRLGLARWLLSADHPLTARVTVNRFWQELFGTGLVRTSGDFGVAGEMPSHPKLLDWLAVDFRESGWDIKRFYKQLVLSSTYRQSATITAAKLNKDPQNRLLARGPRFRMDAEMVRDNALAASGLLVDKIGGPSVRPYQPPGLWEVVGMPDSNTRHYKQDMGESLYRRSVYTFWKRMAPPASLEIFNAPNRETCTVRRERTDTPLQALVTLNDPQYVEAARQLAERSLRQGGQKQTERINFIAKRLLARPLRPAELKIVESGINDLLSHYQQSPKEAEKLVSVGDSKADAQLDKPTLAAYTVVANQLMNLDEVLNK